MGGMRRVLSGNVLFVSLITIEGKYLRLHICNRFQVHDKTYHA